MLATVMPFSKKLTAVQSFLFAFFGIVFFDAVTSGWGSWTWVAASSYGVLALGAHYFFANRDASVKNFLSFGIVATLLFDVVTGVIAGPLIYGQSFSVALTGQIPFTLMHLLSTVVFSVTLSPALYRFVLAEKSTEVVVVPVRA